MLCGNPPFVDSTSMKTYEKILNAEVIFPSYVDNSSRDLIKSLLTIDITKRLGNMRNGVEDIKNHPFFKDVDWKLCYEKQIPPPFQPEISDITDTHNFEKYTEIDFNPPDCVLENDPFR